MKGNNDIEKLVKLQNFISGTAENLRENYADRKKDDADTLKVLDTYADSLDVEQIMSMIEGISPEFIENLTRPSEAAASDEAAQAPEGQKGQDGSKAAVSADEDDDNGPGIIAAHKIMELFKAPEIENADEVRGVRGFFMCPPQETTSLALDSLTVCGCHINSHVLLACYLITNGKIKTEERMNTVGQVLDQVKRYDLVISRLDRIFSKLRQGNDYMTLSTVQCAAIKLTCLFIIAVISKGFVEFEKSLEPWWSAGRIRLNIEPFARDMKNQLRHSIIYDVEGPMDPEMISMVFIFTHTCRMTQAVGLKYFDALRIIDLPPALVGAVPGMNKWVKKLPLATNRKVKPALVELIKSHLGKGTCYMGKSLGIQK